MMTNEYIKMMPDERTAHNAILKFGWNDWKSKHQLGSENYRNFMGKLNPFAKAYFILFERYLEVECLLKEAQSERDHYRERYIGIARSAHSAIKEFSDVGLKS